jgi:hypothetical protein
VHRDTHHERDGSASSGLNFAAAASPRLVNLAEAGDDNSEATERWPSVCSPGDGDIGPMRATDLSHPPFWWV